MRNRFHTKVMAFLLALALFASLAPKTVNAAPVAAPVAMAMDGMMDCDQKMPMPDHQMPCDDGSTCLGMLGCAMLAVPPVAAVTPIAYLGLKSSWPPQAALDGLVHPPALPPPIA